MYYDVEKINRLLTHTEIIDTLWVSDKEMAPARAATPPEPGPQGVSPMDVASVAQAPDLVECFRHEGDECPRCDGSGFRPRKRCAGCGEPSGRPSQGGKALLSLRNRRDRSGPFYCMSCHPELGGKGEVVLWMLDGLHRVA
jgi:hypothetical protein